MNINEDLPHRGKTWEPWPHEPPEGWPYTYVAKVDHDILTARLALCIQTLQSIVTGQCEVESEDADWIFSEVRDTLRKCGCLKA